MAKCLNSHHKIYDYGVVCLNLSTWKLCTGLSDLRNHQLTNRILTAIPYKTKSIAQNVRFLCLYILDPIYYKYCCSVY